MQINKHILTLNDDLGRLRSFLETHLEAHMVPEGLSLMENMWHSFFELSFELEQTTQEMETLKYRNAQFNQELYEPFVKAQTGTNLREVEDIEPIDTSFMCTRRFDLSVCEKNLREAIHRAKSKADACRRVMALEPLGYIVLSNVTDERKAELVNPFATPRYTFNAEDFKKARNR